MTSDRYTTRYYNMMAQRADLPALLEKSMRAVIARYKLLADFDWDNPSIADLPAESEKTKEKEILSPAEKTRLLESILGPRYLHPLYDQFSALEKLEYPNFFKIFHCESILKRSDLMQILLLFRNLIVESDTGLYAQMRRALKANIDPIFGHSHVLLGVYGEIDVIRRILEIAEETSHDQEFIPLSKLADRLMVLVAAKGRRWNRALEAQLDPLPDYVKSEPVKDEIPDVEPQPERPLARLHTANDKLLDALNDPQRFPYADRLEIKYQYAELLKVDWLVRSLPDQPLVAFGDTGCFLDFGEELLNVLKELDDDTEIPLKLYGHRTPDDTERVEIFRRHVVDIFLANWLLPFCPNAEATIQLVDKSVLEDFNETRNFLQVAFTVNDIREDCFIGIILTPQFVKKYRLAEPEDKTGKQP